VPNRLLGSEELRGGTLTELDWCRAAGGGEELLGLARCEADSGLDYFRVSNSLIKHAAATRIFKQRTYRRRHCGSAIGRCTSSTAVALVV
jgi:hypothetical protein